MMRFFLSAALLLGLGSAALANELDNESGVTNQEIQGTLVLRINTVTNEASFAKTDATMGSEEDAKAFAQSAQFSKVPASNLKTELDQDGGASSWYFYYPYYNYNYYQPYCNWYGNYYNPYYNYNYGYYNYYYYGSYWSYYR